MSKKHGHTDDENERPDLRLIDTDEFLRALGEALGLLKLDENHPPSKQSQTPKHMLH